MEVNSEEVQIGKALHKKKFEGKNYSELSIENIQVDKITKDYIVEFKKSDADIEASRWQLLHYLRKLKDKGILKKGKLEFYEKNKSDKKIIYLELTEENIVELDKIEKDIDLLVGSFNIPAIINSSKCKKCSYYEYCYI